ncbi:MAG: sugar kinase, partial [Synechococcus sp.]
MTPLALGIDLGTSGVRIALLDQDETLLFTQAVSYRIGLGQPLDWSDACTELIRSIPNALRDRVQAIAVDGTSGTLLACNATGTPLGQA